MRLLLAFLALFAVTAAPLAMPAKSAAPMEHCAHGKAPEKQHGQQAMDHSTCCVAVDPAREPNANVIEVVAALTERRSDDALAHSWSGADPPPPRLG